MVMSYGREAGDALSIPEELRREMPRSAELPQTVEEKERREREKKVNYLTEKYLEYWKRIGITDPSDEQIEMAKANVTSHLAETQNFWEEYIERRTAAVREQSNHVYDEHEARELATEQVLQVINDASGTSEIALEDVEFVY